MRRIANPSASRLAVYSLRASWLDPKCDAGDYADDFEFGLDLILDGLERARDMR